MNWKTGILRSMNNRKIAQKYFNKKRFPINIFKRNRNMMLNSCEHQN